MSCWLLARGHPPSPAMWAPAWPLALSEAAGEGLLARPTRQSSVMQPQNRILPSLSSPWVKHVPPNSRAGITWKLGLSRPVGSVCHCAPGVDGEIQPAREAEAGWAQAATGLKRVRTRRPGWSPGEGHSGLWGKRSVLPSSQPRGRVSGHRLSQGEGPLDCTPRMCWA